MIRTSIANLSKNKGQFVETVKSNKSLLIFLLTFIFSLFLGSFYVRYLQGFSLDFFNNLFDSFVLIRQNNSFFYIAVNSVISVLPCFFLIFVFGLCVLGPFITPIVLVVRGFGFGSMLGCLYSTHGLKGITFSLLIIVVPALLSTIAILHATRESFCFSSMFFKSVLPKSSAIKFSNDFKLYCLRFVFLFFVIIASALLDSIFSIAFMRFFQF